MVKDLINNTTRQWKEDQIVHTFVTTNAVRILWIPLAELSHENELVWLGEPTGDFSIRSAYKLL